jgi:hypothetical protein
MALIPAGQTPRYGLQPGESLSIVTDANSSCRYGQLPAAPTTPDVPTGGMIAVAASSTIMLGQSGASRWVIDSVLGPGCTVVQNPAQSVADQAAPVDILHLYNAGVPTAATGANQAAPGSLCTDVTNAKLYIQGGSKAVPSWKIITSA